LIIFAIVRKYKRKLISNLGLLKNILSLGVNDWKIVNPIDHEVANAFNTCFSSIGNNLTKSIPIVKKIYLVYII